jgi:peptide/nickel transport system substrate-binding protein
MKRISIALVVCAYILSACSRAGQSGEAGRVNSWTIPHVLRYANGSDISTLNVIFNQDVTIGYMASLTGAWLVKWDERNRPYAELATTVPSKANGGVSADGRTITYHLRGGLRWSDGSALNADDLVWTYHAIMNPANNVVSRSGWDLITRAAEPDTHTVVFHLRKPYAPFVVNFFSSAGGTPILPKHLLAKYPNINNVAYNALPVGAGPFRFKAWDRGQKVVMVPNPYYFRGRPHLSEIDFMIVTNHDTVFTQLATHELDMWAHAGGPYYARRHDLSGYTGLARPTYQWAHLDFNLTHAAVADPIVRHAIELATDRATIIKKYQLGLGSLQEGIAPVRAPYYLPNVPLAPFDVSQANRLLDADGWARGADGIREKNGVRLDLDFAAVTGAVDVDHLIEFMRSTWKHIGVGIDLHHYPDAMLWGTSADGGILYTGKWDVTLFNWVDDPIGDFSYIYACDQFPPSGENVLRWCDTTADAAMRALYAQYDQAGRNADDRILFRQLLLERPQITLFGVDEAYIYNRDLKNFHPNDITPFDGAMDWDI